MMTIDEIIEQALREDLGDGDHTSLATIPGSARGKAQLLVKENGVIAGLELARKVFAKVDPELKMTLFITDGVKVKKGDIAFEVQGPSISILSAERLALNFMQRMSGIATSTLPRSIALTRSISFTPSPFLRIVASTAEKYTPSLAVFRYPSTIASKARFQSSIVATASLCAVLAQPPDNSM